MNRVIHDFGAEWEKFDYSDLAQRQFIEEQFQRYLSPVPENFLSATETIAADFGAGSGRWTRELAKKVKKVHAIEPSDGAFRVLEKKFGGKNNITLHHATIENVSLDPSSLDFAMSLGVLHHIEDTQEALNRIFELLKPGGIFLGYLYYNFENRSLLYRIIWYLSDFARHLISKLPLVLKRAVCDLIAFFVYFPLARTAKAFSKFDVTVSNFPLHQYGSESLYVMRNDSLDRFGTRLEKRYSRKEITEMLRFAGAELESITFSSEEPFWCFAAFKANR